MPDDIALDAARDGGVFLGGRGERVHGDDGRGAGGEGEQGERMVFLGGRW